MNWSKLEYENYLKWKLKSHELMPRSSCGGVEVESDLHDQILEFCRLQNPPWVVIHSRMDQATTTDKGVCDFVIFPGDGEVLCLECKSKKGKWTTDQLGFKMRMEKVGIYVHEVRSFSEFQEIIKKL